MTSLDIVQKRLSNQLITQPMFEKPSEVVRRLGAVQSQDYAAAKWAVGLRLQDAIDDDIEQACTDGTILRTHIMRPTWHFVSPADIRWLLALTAPQVKAGIAYYDRMFALDDAIFRRSNEALAKALQGGKQLTRPELVSVLQQVGIATENLGFLHIIMHAELDGIICSGARRSKQFTYALLDERAPQARMLDHDESLAELANRYFTSHGPATLQDFVWWSGLLVADARVGLELVKSQFMYEVVGDQIYWFSASVAPTKDCSQTAYLLPNFDEYIVGYTDRSAIFDESHTKKLDARGNVLFNHTIVMDGRVVGTWKRTMKKAIVILTASLFTPLNEVETRALTSAAERYGTFLNMAVNVTFQVE
jgi:hypothetical protein